MTDEQYSSLRSWSFADFSGCRLSNDPSGTTTSLQVCNRTEYRCDSAIDPSIVPQTIQFHYSVEYASTASQMAVVQYLEENILEHVAYGLNLTDCLQQQQRSGNRRRVQATAASAVTGLPRDSFDSAPTCEGDTCAGSILAGLTVWAPQESIGSSTAIAEQSVQDVMGMLQTPGAIERVEFGGFVQEGVASTSAWYQNRPLQYSLGGSILFFLLSMCILCICCCRRRRHHKPSLRQPTRHWESLDEEQPIAQRDSLALRPQRSWMIRKARSEPDAAVSDATGDLTNDQHQLSCGSEEDEFDNDEQNGSKRLIGVDIVDSSSMDAGDQKPTQNDELVAAEETDPYILNEVSDDDSEVAEKWRSLHCIDGGSTQGYDEEIIEVLGHIPFDNVDDH